MSLEVFGIALFVGAVLAAAMAYHYLETRP